MSRPLAQPPRITSDFKVAIKLAANAASRKTKIQGSAGPSSGRSRRPLSSGAPLDFGLPGGSDGSRLDYDLETYVNPGRPHERPTYCISEMSDPKAAHKS